MMELVFWIFLCAAIPAAVLYPLEIYLLTHTQISEEVLVQCYGAGICVLFLPTAFLVEFLYRRLVCDCRRSGVQNPN
jgi:hypothetical protein